jgi:hypothetical protein
MKIFSIVLIFFIMADAVWGLLAKSGVDPEKIEYAIVRLIAVHEADPTSHLGVGESLEAHKADPVIDHPAGSVLTDKLSNSELWWQSNFSDIALWTTFDVHDYDWPGMSIPETGTPATTSYLYTNMAGMFGFALPLSYDYFWQAFLLEEHSGTGNVGEFGFGVLDGTPYNGFGFRSDDDKCYAFFRSHTVESTVELADLSFDQFHLYRAQFVADEQAVHFYIDGVEVAVIAKPSGVFDQQVRFGLSLLNDTTDYAFLSIYNVVLTRFP